MIDLKAGQATSGEPMSIDSPNYKMERLRRAQANEYFTPLTTMVINDLKARIGCVPSSLLNINRDVFLKAIDRTPIQPS
jgi:hypothetical protein